MPIRDSKSANRDSPRCWSPALRVTCSFGFFAREENEHSAKEVSRESQVNKDMYLGVNERAILQVERIR